MTAKSRYFYISYTYTSNFTSGYGGVGRIQSQGGMFTRESATLGICKDHPEFKPKDVVILGFQEMTKEDFYTFFELDAK